MWIADSKVKIISQNSKMKALINSSLTLSCVAFGM